MTEYDLVKKVIFEEANEVSERIEKEPSKKKLFGAWEALMSIMDRTALLDEYNKLR